MTRFGQTLTAMVSPFGADESLDLEGAQKLAKWLVANGNDGLVIAGTTGEAPTLTHDEQIALIEAVVDAVDVPVIAGTGSNDTRAAIELTERASAAGATAILSVTPYYNRPSQDGIVAHFRACAGATELPVILYDIPGRTGRKIDTDNIILLAQESNIVGLKDAAGNPGETARVIAETGSDFDVYSGDDALTLPLLCRRLRSHWRGYPLGRCRGKRDDHGVPPRRRCRGRPNQSNASRVLGYRDGRFAAEPDSEQDHAASTRSPRRPVPSADGPRARRPRRPVSQGVV